LGLKELFLPHHLYIIRFFNYIIMKVTGNRNVRSLFLEPAQKIFLHFFQKERNAMNTIRETIHTKTNISMNVCLE